MKAIMVMFDSLNRHMLPPYGCDWIKAPNFERLAKQSVTFDKCYAGSLPCIPARREIHTGRYNFLHRSWGPIEPYDISMPELLKARNIYTHLVSDHFHYWEDGGATYHSRYNSWEIVRGQQVDTYKGEVKDPEIPNTLNNYKPAIRRHDLIDRKYCADVEENFPQAVTFNTGLEFIETNKHADNWFLHIETFDPHEPFVAPQKYRDLYPHEYDGPNFDWPPYGTVTQSESEVNHCRMEYAALISMCDNYLGLVLDKMDKYNMWEDTMLIVNTDHGFFLGEKSWWGKTVQPYYNEVSNIPLFIWDPRAKQKNVVNNQLVQTIDLAPTILEYFNAPIPEEMEGKPLYKTIMNNEPVRDAALFGVHGGHVNCTDGRYVYMRGCKTEENKPLFNYTLMPTHMRGFFQKRELESMEISNDFSFTGGIPLLKIENKPFHNVNSYKYGTLLFDLYKDQDQVNPIEDEAVEKEMIKKMVKLMKKNEAPKEQYIRLGLDESSEADI